MKRLFAAQSITCKGVRETQRWARRLGALLQPGDVIGLDGPMGVGKTHFVQGLARGVGVPRAVRVASPTFALVHEYPGRIPLYHADLYRLQDPREWYELGLWDTAHPGATVIEWASLFPQFLPSDFLQIMLSFGTHASNERVLWAQSHGPRSHQLLITWASREIKGLESSGEPVHLA